MRWLGAGAVALGVGLAASSVLGPLITGVIRYRVADLMVSQLKGADAVSLILVAPASVAVGIVALRGYRMAAPLALGPAAYTMYMVTEVVIGPDYSGIPGNIERFVPLFLGLFVVAGAVGAGAWAMTNPRAVPALSRRRARLIGGGLTASAVLLVVGRYVPALSDALSAHPTNAAYRASPTIFWVIAWEDLGIVIPAMITAGIATWRGSGRAVPLRCAIVGWSALVPVAVVGMAVSMYADGEPGASRSDIAVLALLALFLMTPAGLSYLRPRAGGSTTPSLNPHRAVLPPNVRDL